MKFPRLISSFVVLNLCSVWANAQGERLGVFRFSDFALSPRVEVSEPSTGGISLKESWIGFEWTKDSDLRAELSFGTQDLRRPAVWFTESSSDLQLVEAFIHVRSEYLDLRVGLLDISFGYEGHIPEWSWILPVSRVRREGWFIRRDLGFEVKAERGLFSTGITLHNGESKTNQDNKMWYTGFWKIGRNQGWGLLWTASFGLTTPDSTAGSSRATDEGFVFDSNLPGKVRMGTMGLFYQRQRNLFLAEYGRGDVIQNDKKNPFAWGQVDTAWNFLGDAFVLARYEQSRANLHDVNTQRASSGLGLGLSSKDRLSLLSLFLRKNDEVGQLPNDEAVLSFRLNSNKL